MKAKGQKGYSMIHSSPEQPHASQDVGLTPLEQNSERTVQEQNNEGKKRRKNKGKPINLLTVLACVLLYLSPFPAVYSTFAVQYGFVFEDSVPWHSIIENNHYSLICAVFVWMLPLFVLLFAFLRKRIPVLILSGLTMLFTIGVVVHIITQVRVAVSDGIFTHLGAGFYLLFGGLALLVASLILDPLKHWNGVPVSGVRKRELVDLSVAVGIAVLSFSIAAVSATPGLNNVKEGKYREGIASLDGGRHIEAYESFSGIRDYKDVERLISEIIDSAYDAADVAMVAGDYNEAFELFNFLRGTHEDAGERAEEARQKAEEFSCMFKGYRTGTALSIGDTNYSKDGCLTVIITIAVMNFPFNDEDSFSRDLLDAVSMDAGNYTYRASVFVYENASTTVTKDPMGRVTSAIGSVEEANFVFYIETSDIDDMYFVFKIAPLGAEIMRERISL